MITKTLTCSAKGNIVGEIRFDGYNTDDIEKAMSEAKDAKEKLGLKMYCLKRKDDTYNNTTYVIRMIKTDTAEHFHHLAGKARCRGWE